MYWTMECLCGPGNLRDMIPRSMAAEADAIHRDIKEVSTEIRAALLTGGYTIHEDILQAPGFRVLSHIAAIGAASMLSGGDRLGERYFEFLNFLARGAIDLPGIERKPDAGD